MRRRSYHTRRNRRHERRVRFLAGSTLRHSARNLGSQPPILIHTSGVDARYVSGATSPRAQPACSIGLGSDFRPTRLVTTAHRFTRSRSIPLGRLVPVPTPPPDLLLSWSPIVEDPVSNFKTPTHDDHPTPKPSPTPAVTDLHRAARHAEQTRRDAEQCAKLTSLPVEHAHAAGIDVGDASHWVCVESTPDNSDTVREFPAHTAGLRLLVTWLHQCAVTTVALEATGVYAHVLLLTLLEAGFVVVMTAPQFARQIKGRPKTDKRDCQWIQRLHKHGLLPPIFQPDETTQTLRDYVRQRANLVLN